MVKRSLGSQNLTVSQETHQVYFSKVPETITQKGKVGDFLRKSPVESLRQDFDSQVEQNRNLKLFQKKINILNHPISVLRKLQSGDHYEALKIGALPTAAHLI